VRERGEGREGDMSEREFGSARWERDVEELGFALWL
jgi:hypothetical protein